MKSFIYIYALSLALTACSGTTSTTASTSMSDEIAQNIGDSMAGIDEAGGSSGSISQNSNVKEAQRLFARYAPTDLRKDVLVSQILPQAQATTCFAHGFGSCTSNSITRNFGGCTVGIGAYNLTYTGSVAFTWSGAGASTCSMSSTSDSVTRNPNFTITTPAGASFAVSKTGTDGQKLTLASGSGTSRVFNFSNDGIRRVVTSSTSATLYDFTTSTTSNITVTGTTRSNRVMNGGTLHVVNNLTSVTCDISPSNVTWSSTCTCASSGTWSGSCSDGNTVNLSISSCGSGTLTLGSSSTGVSFDSCTGS